jgi:uncharacterized protein (DUF433 family)
MAIERISIDPDGQPFIRGLQIKFRDLYRDLTFHGLKDCDVLQKYAGLEAEDIAAVREYAVHLITKRTQDEFTGRPILPRKRLRHGAFYKGRCRNATIARWNAQEQCFYYWREKFGRIYIQTIKYPTDEDEPWWDVFDVVEELKNLKFEIPFNHDALFTGNREDLYEYNAEMWNLPQ